MRKPLRIVTFCMSLLVAVSAATHALCESDYVTIAELRESLPERWVGEYVVQNGAYKQLEKGDTVSVDVPIVVPEVDAVPVVRITWEPPAEDWMNRWRWSGMTGTRKESTRNFPMDELAFPVLEDHMTFTPELPWEEAPAIAMAEFQKWMPFMKEKELTPLLLRALMAIQDGNGFQGVMLLYDLSWHTASH